MSEIKVNKISPRTNCGTVTVGDSGDSVTVTSGVPVTVNGDLKSNALKATDGGSIISQCGTTITIGASGDTINLASGASQTGFGRTGTVDWQTGSIKTSTFSATSGEGYFCDTSSGGFTLNLPAGVAGAIVGISDYASSFNSQNLTVARNGSDKINGNDGDLTLSTQGQALSLVFVDSTRGWKAVTGDDTNPSGTPPAYVTATGGTVTTVCTNFKVHTFTGPGTFCVSCAGNAGGNTQVEYLVIAGGGGSGGSAGTATGSGGGGAGGYRESPGATAGCYTVSPLGAAPAAAITVSASPYPISVGGGGGSGGSGYGNTGGTGSTSSGLGISSAGGGGGSGYNAPASGSGGSGAGGAAWGPSFAKGDGNTPPVNPPQGNPGGRGTSTQNSTVSGGGGGGATGAGGEPGATSPLPSSSGGVGGCGATSSINGTPTARASGGVGGGSGNTPATPGGGAGSSGGCGTNGTANTGGGASGSSTPGSGSNSGASGGSGVVIIRYKFQN